MTINHINLVVSDVGLAADFFIQHFGFDLQSVKGDHVIAVLSNSKGFVLVLSRSREEVPAYPKDFHIGFMLDTATEVDETYARLNDAGLAMGRQPGKIRDSYAFYFTFDQILIEVGTYS